MKPILHIPFCILVMVLGSGCGSETSTNNGTPELIALPDRDTELTVADVEPLPVAPEEWGGGFINLSAPIEEKEPFFVYKGSAAWGDLADNTGGFFADLDGDQLPEVILGNLQCCYTTHRSSVFKYDVEKRALTYSAELSAKFDPGQGKASMIVDLDNDGNPDLITRRADRGIHWGLPGYEFGEYVPFPEFEGQPTPSHMGALHLVDLDQDGWLDLLLGDGECREDGLTITPLIQTGPQKLEARPDLLEGQQPNAFPYAVIWAPIGEGLIFSAGRPCSDANPNAGFFTYQGLREDGYPRYGAEDVTPFESIYKEDPEVSFGPLPWPAPWRSAWET